MLRTLSKCIGGIRLDKQQEVLNIVDVSLLGVGIAYTVCSVPSDQQLLEELEDFILLYFEDNLNMYIECDKDGLMLVYSEKDIESELKAILEQYQNK